MLDYGPLYPLIRIGLYVFVERESMFP